MTDKNLARMSRIIDNIDKICNEEDSTACDGCPWLNDGSCYIVFARYKCDKESFDRMMERKCRDEKRNH